MKENIHLVRKKPVLFLQPWFEVDFFQSLLHTISRLYMPFAWQIQIWNLKSTFTFREYLDTYNVLSNRFLGSVIKDISFDMIYELLSIYKKCKIMYSTKEKITVIRKDHLDRLRECSSGVTLIDSLHEPFNDSKKIRNQCFALLENMMI